PAPRRACGAQAGRIGVSLANQEIDHRGEPTHEAPQQVLPLLQARSPAGHPLRLTWPPVLAVTWDVERDREKPVLGEEPADQVAALVFDDRLRGASHDE